MECGIGIKDDMSNFINETELSIITNIGLNHQEVFGDTIEDIANNKKEVIKFGCDFILYDSYPIVEEITKQKCKEVNSNFHKTNFDEFFIVNNTLEKRIFNYKDYQNIELSLYGESQMKNACVAIEAVEALRNRGWNISDKNIYDGLKSAYWGARFDTICEKPKIIFNGGGKATAVENLKSMLKAYYPDTNIYTIFNARPEKDPDEIVKALDDLATELYFIDNLEDECNGKVFQEKYTGISYCFASLEECLNEACKKAKENDGIVVVAGPYGLYRDTLNYIKDNYKLTKNALLYL